MSKKDLIRGASLVSVAEVFSRVIGLGGFAVLAIWLTPADYGQFAIAWMFFVVADTFFDLGTSISYHQHAKQSPKAFGLYRSLLLMLGISWTLLMLCFCAYLWVSAKEQLAETLLVLSGSLIFRSLSVPYFAYWVRNNTYRYLIINQTLSSLIGVAASVYMAYRGFGEVSLAVRYPVAAICGFVLVLFAGKFIDRLYVDFGLYRDWLIRGFKYTTSVNWGWMLFFYVEQQIILNFYGEAVLGLYNYAKKLIEVGMQVIGNVSRLVVQPYFIQHGVKLAKVFAISGLLLVVGFFGCVLGVLALPLVMPYIDNSWVQAAEYLSYLIFILPVGLSASVFVAFWVSIDRFSEILKAELIASTSLAVLGGLSAYQQMSVHMFIIAVVFSYLLKLVYFWIRARSTALRSS
jgi:O-antigen/teichoic acid export membrane protein